MMAGCQPLTEAFGGENAEVCREGIVSHGVVSLLGQETLVRLREGSGSNVYHKDGIEQRSQRPRGLSKES